jgi:hypothetical protein
MKKLLMTLGIVLGFTAALSAQSPEAKASEVQASKPSTKAVAPDKVVMSEKQTTNLTPVKVVSVEKQVTKEIPAKGTTKIDAASQAKPVFKAKVVKPAETETPIQAPEAKPAKEKENN